GKVGRNRWRNDLASLARRRPPWLGGNTLVESSARIVAARSVSAVSPAPCPGIACAADLDGTLRLNALAFRIGRESRLQAAQHAGANGCYRYESFRHGYPLKLSILKCRG